MNQTFRKTGIDIIGDVSWGTHICQFYQTKSDLLEILVPYFKAGLENNEFCIWITSPPLNEGEAVEAICRAMPNFNPYLEKGQIEILPDTGWYFKEGEFNIQVVLNGWIARLDQALAKGYEGLRVAGCMFLEKEDWKKLVDYEEEIKKVIDRYPMMAICNYSIDKCGASEVIDVAVNHRFILIKKNAIWELIENIRLKRAEDALRRSEEQLRLITDSLPVLICYVDSEQCYRFINKAYESWYSLPRGEIYGRHLKEVLGESAYQVIQGYVERVLSGRQTTYEAWVSFKSGGIRYVSGIYVPHFDEQRKVKGYFALITDITEKKKVEEELRKYREHLEELVEERTAKFKIANEQLQQEIIERKSVDEKIQVYQEQLRSLASELALLEERERRRIAVDLHDNIGQTLAISKIKLGELRELVSPSLVKQLNEVRDFIEQTIQYTRSLTFELSPPILYEVGFEAAVEWLAEQIQEQHNISVKFEDDKQPKPMEEEVRILLFKAVSELLMNVVKHAQARKAEVAIQREGSNMRITVEDNGVGFYISEASQIGGIGGFGLFSIRERLRHFGGSLQIQSEPGRGTRVTLLAPLKEKE